MFTSFDRPAWREEEAETDAPDIRNPDTRDPEARDPDTTDKPPRSGLQILTPPPLRRPNLQGGQTATSDAPESADRRRLARSEQELTLERELAVALSRKPRQPARSSLDQDGLTADRETGADRFLMTRRHRATEAPPAAGTSETAAAWDAGSIAPTPDAEPVFTAAAVVPAAGFSSPRPSEWVRQVRRKRRYAGLRSAASWLVTLAVASFIVGVVAVIVIGLPKGLL